MWKICILALIVCQMLLINPHSSSTDTYFTDGKPQKLNQTGSKLWGQD